MRRILQPVPVPGGVASFPRTPAAVSPLAAAALRPVLLNVYDPPVQPAVLAPAAIPSSGVAEDVEVRTFDVLWPNDGAILAPNTEVVVYATTRQWPALDVYIQSADVMTTGQVMTVRVYALSVEGERTLISSGRVGHLDAIQALRVPVWICAARAQATRFLVTFALGAGNPQILPALAGQSSSITIVGTNEANDAPELLGAIPFASVALASSALTSVGIEDACLLMAQATLGAAVAAPRYLHVHNKTGALAASTPVFCFPLGAGVAANGGGGFGGTWWFPGGWRPGGADNLIQLAVSSTADVTTLAADCVIQGMAR